MSGLWLAGGRQVRAAGALDRHHTALYGAGVLAWLDLEAGAARPVLEDVSAWGPGSCFKGLAASGSDLWACHPAEVVVVRDGVVCARHTDPRMNDVHHARPLGGARVVASTGADGVLVGETFVPVHAGPRPVGDLRGRDLAPHAAHPNHVFEVDGTPFVTRGVLGDAVALDGSARWRLADVVVHDGVVQPDGVWFTAVDGRLLRVAPARGVVDRVIRLPGIVPEAEPLGWCRGLAIVGDTAWVGFTRLRTTRFRRHLAWVRGAIRGAQRLARHPTRVVAIDLRTERWRATVGVEGAGVHALFGIVPAAGLRSPAAGDRERA